MPAAHRRETCQSDQRIPLGQGGHVDCPMERGEQHVSTPWDASGCRFDIDDGTLPDVTFTSACATQLVRLYDWLQSRASHLSFHHRLYTQQSNIRVQFGGNPDSGEADPFHWVFGELMSQSGLSVPILGELWLRGEMIIDYKVGRVWGHNPSKGALRYYNPSCCSRTASNPRTQTVSMTPAANCSMCGRDGAEASLYA